MKKGKPMKLGFKNMPHAEKMAAKKAHNQRLAQMAYDDPQAAVRIASMVNAMQGVRRKNGVGPKSKLKKYLVERSAA